MKSLLREKKHSTVRYHKRRIFNGTWEVFSVVTTVFMDGGSTDYENWVANCLSEGDATILINQLSGK